MDWNSLKVFIAIARHGSLSGAAIELGVNHSTVFRRLHAFEQSIDGKLFERVHNHYELTTLGHELLGLAKNVENGFYQIDRHIVGKEIQPKGNIKITAPNNIAYRYLPRYLNAFNRQYPEITVELLVSNQNVNMSNRQADIAVRATPSPPQHLVGRQVATLSWSLFAGNSYDSDATISPEFNNLTEHAFIGATGPLARLPAFIWLERHFSTKIRARSDDLNAMSYFAESGQGLALLPADQARPELKQLTTMVEIPPSHLWLLTHPDLRNVARIKLLMQHLTSEFSKEFSS